MNDEQVITRALQDARRQLADVEARIALHRAAGDEMNAQRWEDQHGRPLRERIEVYETQLAAWRGEVPGGAVMDAYRKQAGEGGNDGR